MARTSIEQEAARYAKLLSKYDELVPPRTQPAKDVKKLARALGAPLPAQLIALYEQTQVDLESISFCVYAGKRRAARALRVLSADPPTDTLDTLRLYRELDDWDPHWIPIAQTGGGQMLTVHVVSGRVGLWDDHVAWPGDERVLEPVAKDLVTCFAASNDELERKRNELADNLFGRFQARQDEYERQRALDEETTAQARTRVGMTRDEVRALEPTVVLAGTSAPFPPEPDVASMRRMLGELRLLTALAGRDTFWSAVPNGSWVAEVPMILPAPEKPPTAFRKSPSLTAFYSACDGVERFDRSLSLVPAAVLTAKKQREMVSDYVRRERPAKALLKGRIVFGFSPYLLDLVALVSTEAEYEVEQFRGSSADVRRFPSLWAFLVERHRELRTSG